MIRFVQIALLLAIVIPFGAARAQFYTGNDIHDACTKNRLLAVGYVSGVFDGSKITEWFDDNEVVKLCVPIGVTNGQLLDVVCKRLADKPENRHTAAAFIVLDAVQAAFPCPKKKKP